MTLLISVLGSETLTNLITIILMLLGSFALGYLFRLFLNIGLQQRLSSKESAIVALQKELAGAQTKLQDQAGSHKLEEQIAILSRSKDLLQRDLENANNDRAKLKIQLADIKRIEIETPSKELTSSFENVKVQPQVSKPATIQIDPLRKIEGIGPKIEEILHKHGILTFKILSNSDIGKLREIVHGANPAYKVHDPTTWPDQARLAHQGKWESLDLLQSQLKGGKRS